jgi:hypothetical protein
MGYFFLPQMDDSFTEGVCFDNRKEGKGERRFGAPHCVNFRAGVALRHQGETDRRVGAK